MSAKAPFVVGSKSTAVIIFKNERIPIIPKVFRLFCPSYSGVGDFRIVEEDLDLAVVKQFVDICQAKTFAWPDVNLLELLRLSVVYEQTELEAQIREYIERPSNRRRLLLQSIKYESDMRISTAFHEKRLREDFMSWIGDPLLLELPLAVLNRLVPDSADSETSHILFPFLMRCLNRFGPGASILFHSISLKNLDFTELDQLLQIKDSDRLVPSLPGDFLFGAFKHYRREVDRLNRELAAKQQTIDHQEETIRHKSQEIEDLRRTVTHGEDTIARQKAENAEIAKQLPEIERLRKELAYKDEVIAASQAQIDFLGKPLDQRLKTLEKTSDNVDRTKNELQRQYNEFHTRLGALQAKVQEQEHEIANAIPQRR
jgi:hypothetical protein